MPDVTTPVTPTAPAADIAPTLVSAPVAAPAPVPVADATMLAPTEETLPALQAVSNPPADPNEVKKKILVVEDEQDARTMFVDLLESEGFDVSSAVDGIDALAKSASEKYDLILLDIVMPNMDGVEVLQQIKADPTKYGTPIVVMLTNISGDAAVEKAMELGAAGYRLKIGTEPEKLLQDVKDFLAGKVQDVKAEPVSPSFT